MDNVVGLAARDANVNGGDAPVRRNRSLRRLFPKKGSVSSIGSSDSSSMGIRSPTSTISNNSRSNPPVTYSGRYSPQKTGGMFRRSSGRNSNSSQMTQSTQSTQSGQPPYLQTVHPPLSEAARLRMNSGQRSPISPSQSRQDLPYSSENFSRPRNASIRQSEEHNRPPPRGASLRPSEEQSRPPPRGASHRPSEEHSRPPLHSSNTFPLELRNEQASLYAPPPSFGRERGNSGSSTLSATFQPHRPLQNSHSIPDLRSCQKPANPNQNLNVTPRDNVNRARENRPSTGDDVVRESLYSNQTTATNATSTTWMTSPSESWTAASSFLDPTDTERSSIRSKASSTMSVAGREAIDDLLGMYEKGFDSGADDEPSNAKRQSRMSEKSDRTRIPDPSSPNKAESPLPSRPPTLDALNTTHIIRDSTDMFTSPTSPKFSEAERKFIDPFHEHPVTQGGPGLEPYQYTKRAPTSLSQAMAERQAAQTPASQFDNSRDRYGFKKISQYVTLEEWEAWSKSYDDHLLRRRRKWVALLQECGLEADHPRMFPPRSSKTKRFIRKGIPPDWRGEAWFWYGGGPEMLAKNPGLYAELVHKAANGRVSATDEELIERDLNRTFPDNVLFKPDPEPGQSSDPKANETPLLKKLRRVLQATSIYNPKIGYCQSLNFLAGLLLLFMDEERAFWMLDIITKQYLPGTHEVNLEGANVDLGVLMTSVRESMPAVWAKIGGELDGTKNTNGDGKGTATMRLPPITLCCTAWFMSCFIGTLPIETTLRVWDSFFYEGSKTLFRIALAIFKVGEAEIKAVNDPMEIFQVVQTIPRRLVDANALLEACFRRRNGFGHLSQETIEERRKERRRGYADERAGRAVSLGEQGKSRKHMGLGGHGHNAAKVFASMRSKR